MKKRKKSHIVCFASLKGGAGKTLNCFNIGGILAEEYKVLFIDSDPQCNLSYNCGIRISGTESYSVRDVFEMDPRPKPEKVIVKSPIKELPNLDIIPASIYLFESEEKMVLRADRERILERYFEDFSSAFNAYDYILIDTNPSMSTTNVNCFNLADDIILSSDVSINSITGAELFCNLWDKKRRQLRKEDNIGALIICNYNGQSNFAKDLLEFTKIKDFSRDIVCQNIISSTVKLKETESTHKPINILYPNHKSCAQYRALIKELKESEVF